MDHKYSTYFLLVIFLVCAIALVLGLDGGGTSNHIAKFYSPERIVDSSIIDDGENVTILGNINVNGSTIVKTPYLFVSDNTTQTIPSPNTPYVMNFSTLEDNYMIYIVNRQNITFNESGDYLFIISAIVTVSSANKHVEVWFQKNGVNIPRSNTRVEYVSPNVETTLAVPFILGVLKNDTIRVMWASDDAGSIVYTANTSYSPASPSIIMSVHKVGEITP